MIVFFSENTSSVMKLYIQTYYFIIIKAVVTLSYSAFNKVISNDHNSTAVLFFNYESFYLNKKYGLLEFLNRYNNRRP